MTQPPFRVEVGYQVFLAEGGEEVGAVREIAPDHLVVYIEAAGDFKVPGGAVKSAHDGKVVLDEAKLDARLLDAARTAHERETD